MFLTCLWRTLSWTRKLSEAAWCSGFQKEEGADRITWNVCDVMQILQKVMSSSAIKDFWQLFHTKSSGFSKWTHQYKGCVWLCSMMDKLKTRNHCALSLLLLECYNSTFDLLNQQISPTKKVLLQSVLALLFIMSSHITCRVF